MEAHCVNLELKYQNQALKEGQHGQFLKVKSNEAKVKHDIDVIETINIELEHKVAKLLKENKTLKRHYKEMFDSIKTTRAKNIEHTTSLIANNDKFKAQLQEKGFAIAALKMRKPALQDRRNQLVVRQPTAFKSERPRFSKQRFASKVDVNNDLSKPVTTHYLPKERKSVLQTSSHDCTWLILDITNQYECAQTLDVSAGTSNLSTGLAPLRQMTSDHNTSELRIHDHINKLSSSKLVPKVVPPVDKTATSR
ncbi:hypothetical protein Tco_0817240 [Tanacetum coccineum]